MTIPETLLTFVGAPALIVAVITTAALGPSAMKAPSRYRPGRPWTHAPAWFIPHPVTPTEPRAHAGGHSQLTAPHPPPAIASRDVEAGAAQAAGGASGEW